MSDFKKYPQYLKLNPEQQIFTSGVISGLTLQEAYHAAYPQAGPKTVASKAYKLIKNENVAYCVREAKRDLAAGLEATQIATIESIKEMAFADPQEFMKVDGTPRKLKDVPKELRACITEVEFDGDKVKYKLTGKLKALELLAKMCRLTESQSTQVQVNIMTENERDDKIKEILVKAIGNDTDGND